jgi:hypothetical protein
MFQSLESNIGSVVDAFQRAISPARLAPFGCNVWDGDYAIDAHTRYFTDRRHAPSLRHEGFSNGIDPKRFLDVMRGVNFIHCDENRVEYCKRDDVGGNVR